MLSIHRLLGTIVLAIAGAALVLHVPAKASAEESLAEQLQRKYASIKDFSADFVHAYQGGVLKKQITERGHVLIKKPGKMRWEYVAPEEKVFVSDGVKMYSYLPQDKQVIVTAVPRTQRPAGFGGVSGRKSRPRTRFHHLPHAVASGNASWGCGAEACSQVASSGLRLARPGRSTWFACHRGARHRGRPGRTIQLFLRKSEGKRRIVR